ncbi:MAG: lysoplasmalogenase [Bacteroidales bacterium]|nr:lysoplasmalogenase [Bacteroidales bacterium]
MKSLLDKRYLIPAFILAGVWYTLCIRFIPEPWCAPFKVIPLALVVAALARELKAVTADRATLVLPIIALSFSMVGDVFGDLKLGSFEDTAFLLQIFFFMAAHFVYIASFVRFARRPRPDGLTKTDAAFRLVCTVAIVVFLLVYSNIIIPKVESAAFRYAIGAYMIVISVMVLSAIMQSRPKVWPVIIGAMVFVASDSVIAWSAFVPGQQIPVVLEDWLVMGTYYAAQLLINIGLLKR